MNFRIGLPAGIGVLLSTALLAQDAMQYGLGHLRVLAEDDEVRVLKYSPRKGDKTPMKRWMTSTRS